MCPVIGYVCTSIQLLDQMKTITLLLLSVTILSVRAERAARSGEQDTLSARFSLSEVTGTALANNASIKALRAKWEMMKARIPQASAWEDPMVGVDFERRGTTRFDTYGDSEWMVSQKIPIAGKNRSLARVANAEALGALEELRRRQLDVIAKTRAAYFRLLNAHAQLEVNRRNESLAAEFSEISRAKYEVGTETQANVLVAETDRLRLIENRRDLERELSAAESELNVLMNRAARAPVGQPVDVSLKHPGFQLQRIEMLALQNRPELQLTEQEIAAGQYQLQAAKRDWIPEPQLRIESRHFKGSNDTFREYDTGVFFSVPWGNWGKYRARESEAKKRIEMSMQDLESARAETLGLVRDGLEKVETFHHHVELFRERLLPADRQTVEASRIGYGSDKTGFLELITAQRSLRDTESAYHRHLADYRTALAELEAIVGVDLHIFPSVGLTTTSRESK